MRLTAAILATAIATASLAEAPAKVTPKSDAEKTVYAIGLSVQKSLEPFSLTSAELELVLAGVRDAAAGTAVVKLEEQQAAIQKLVTSRRAAQGAELARKGEGYLEKATKAPGAVKTASGLVFVPLKEGTGEAPTATSKVKVNYEGKLVDGKVFDASSRHGGPATFPLNGVIACWTEGIQKLKVGGKGRLVCPPALAYGERGAGAEIPPGALLDFEVELLEIVK